MNNIKIAGLYRNLVSSINSNRDSVEIHEALESYIDELKSKKEERDSRLKELISQIKEPTGAWDRDMVKYQANVISTCRGLAEEALLLIEENK